MRYLPSRDRGLLVGLAAAVSVSVGIVSADAAVIDSEDFESFGPVPIEVISDFDWQVAAGQEANVNVVGASLSVAGGVVSLDGGTQALQVGPDLPSATTNNLADWVFTSSTSDDIWFRYLIQTSETASTSIPNFADDRDFFQIFLSEAGDQAQSLSMLLDNVGGGAPDSDHNFRARAGSSGNVTDNDSDLIHQPTETYLVVGHLEKGVSEEYETVTVYVNQFAPEELAVPTASATFEGVNALSIGQLTFRISALETTDSYLVDEIVIGESYDDVVPVDPNFTTQGDFDGNGSLEPADFQILAGNLFENGTHAEGDYDLNGTIDLHDFIDFRAAFLAAGGDIAALSIPEPNSLILLGIFCVTWMAWIRGRTRSRIRS